jgi:mRNA interferase HicA
VKRKDLLKRIEAAAKASGLAYGLVRNGAAHDIYSAGDQRFTVPRHREINELTALAIFKDLQDELGPGWWK